MLLFATVLAVALSAQANDGPEETPAPAEHVWGEITPIADADGHSLDAFHKALRKTARGEAKTRILQFGASHTAADLFTGYLRRRLQDRFGDAGHGWFMPVRPWRTYRHQDIKFENSKSKRLRWNWERVSQLDRPFVHEDGLLGLAGMSVDSDSKRQWGRFRTSNSGPYGDKATQFELWYRTQKGGGDLWLTIDGKRQKIKTRGKSGVGYFTKKLADRGHQIELRPRGNGQVRLFGAVMEREHNGVVLDTLGINGSRAANMLAWDYKTWAELVKRRDPALIILAYGTNESGDKDEPIAVYEKNLRTVLKRVRKAAPRASCVLFGPTDRPKVHRISRKDPLPSFTLRPRTAAIVEVQRKVTAELGCGFFDAVAATGGNFSIVSWAHAEPRLAYKDFVHLTNRGYRRIADLFYGALMSGFAE